MAKVLMKIIRALLGLGMAKDGVVSSSVGAVLTGMTNNTAYPTPPVSMADLKTGLDTFNTSVSDAEDGGKKAVAARDKARAAVIKLYRVLGHYVEANCNDDMATFMTSGFQPVPTKRTPPAPLAVPFVRNLDHGTTGQLLVTITPIPKALSYELRYGAVVAGAAPATWTTDVLTKAKQAYPINALTPGTIYAFQVRALGKVGFTDWSDSTTLMCI